MLSGCPRGIGVSVIALALQLFCADQGLSGYAENQSYTTACAEVDNINIPLVHTNATAYRITASHPDYYPSSIVESGPDFTDCEFTDRRIWIMGANDGSNAEFQQNAGLFSNEVFATDNPGAGRDEVSTNMPKEINNDWWNNQYIRFTADEAGDANTELTIGADLTVSFATVSGTLEIKMHTWNGTIWVDRGSKTFTSTTRTNVWSIPDFTWLEGTDANNVQLDVVTAGEGGGSLAGSWAIYDYVELRKRNELGETVYPTLFDNGTVSVQAVHIDFWWQAPTNMTVSVDGGLTQTDVHYLRISKKLPTEASWPQIFVLYQDGNARIIPHPPESLASVPFGASVIIGPTKEGERPYAVIESVDIDPIDLSLDITYIDGATAHVELHVSREEEVVDVTQITYDVSTQSFARMRSMWVYDGNSDMDRIANEDGSFAILNPWTSLTGTWWNFQRAIDSYHNTYCPEFKIDVLGPDVAYATMQGETPDAHVNGTVVARTNAVGDSALHIHTSGGEATYSFTTWQSRPNTLLLARYADETTWITGRSVDVYFDGAWAARTFTLNTSDSNEFEYLPFIELGDVATGIHTVRLVAGSGAGEFTLDQVELISQPYAAYSTNVINIRQGESVDSGSGYSTSNRTGAVGGQTLVVSNEGATAHFEITVTNDQTNVFTSFRHSDELNPNKLEFLVDNVLVAQAPSMTHGLISLNNGDLDDGPSSGGTPTGWTKYGNAGQESWAAENGSANGVGFYGWVANGTGSVEQTLTVDNSIGNIYTFHMSALFEPLFESSSSDTWLTVEFWVNGEGSPRSEHRRNVYDVLRDESNQWHDVFIRATNTDSAVNSVKVMFGFSSGAGAGNAAKWDNAYLIQGHGGGREYFTNSPPIYLGSIADGAHTVTVIGATDTVGLELDEWNLFTVERTNRAPSLETPSGTIYVRSDFTTNFAVAVTEQDPDDILLTNPVAPTNATFATNYFAWTPRGNDVGTTSFVEFVVNDQRSTGNSMVTNTVKVVVPYESTDLSIAMSVDDENPVGGQTNLWTMVVTNGADRFVTDVAFSNLFPDGITFTFVHSISAGSYDGVTGIWSIGMMTNGQVATLQLETVVDESAPEVPITNTFAMLSAGLPDTNAANDLAKGVIVPLSTFAVFADVSLDRDGDDIYLTWETASEVGTAGFFVERQADNGLYERVTADLVPALYGSPRGGWYRMRDPHVVPGETYAYRLIEEEMSGHARTHGPYTLTAPAEESSAAGVGERHKVSRTAVTRTSKAGRADRTIFRKARPVASKASSRHVQRSIDLSNRPRKPMRGGHVKMLIDADAVHFASVSMLSQHFGIPPGPIRALLRTGQLTLQQGGADVAYTYDADDDGFYFVGRGGTSIFSRAQAYWVGYGVASNMAVYGGDPPSPSPSYAGFMEHVHVEEDRLAMTAVFDDPQDDFWVWDTMVGGAAGFDSKTYTVTVARVASEPGVARITVDLVGVSRTGVIPEHHARIRFNGEQVDEVWWDNKVRRTVYAEFDSSRVMDGDNLVEIIAYRDEGVPFSVIAVDSIDLEYPRAYEALDDELVVRSGSNESITVRNFSMPDIHVLDVTDPDHPLWLANSVVEADGASYAVHVQTPHEGDRMLHAFTKARVKPVQDYSPAHTTSLANPALRADYVMIGPREWLSTAWRLAAYRAGQGHETMLVDVEDVYDAFNGGNASPNALREFLSYAYTYWELPPRYVVLVGRGTYDYKDLRGYGDSVLPALLVGTPYGLFASDSQLGDVVGEDGIPEIAVGRIPALTMDEVDRYVDKVIAYEAADGTGWSNRVMMVADTPDKAGAFSADSDRVADLVAESTIVEKVYLSDMDLAPARSDLMAGLSNGVAILNYMGHGGMDRMSSQGLMVKDDVASLANADRTPLVLSMTCILGRYEVPGYVSLAEDLVLHPDGGAIGAWSPSGLSLNHVARIMNEEAFKRRFEAGDTIVGDLLLEALEGTYDRVGGSFLFHIYNYLGDPATRIK